MLQKFTRLFFYILLAGFCALPVQSAFALELIYPEDGSYVTKSDYLIIKAGTSPEITGLVIDINGVGSEIIDISSAEYKKFFADMLILEPTFDPGKNQVRVYSYVGREPISEVAATVYFVDKFNEQPPGNFDPFVMHTAEKERVCAGCHNMSPTQEQFELMGIRNPCASCHKRMLGKKHVHGPAGVFQCAYCHENDGGGRKYLVEDPDGDCVECHDDMVLSSRGNQFVHGPIEAGLCVVCHDPHASDNIAQLVAPVNDLCMSCHEIDFSVHAVRGVSRRGHPLSGDYDPFHPDRQFSCVSCHDPHKGTSPYYLRFGISDRLELCQKCHHK